jgi:hypothetical protein
MSWLIEARERYAAIAETVASEVAYLLLQDPEFANEFQEGLEAVRRESLAHEPSVEPLEELRQALLAPEMLLRHQLTGDIAACVEEYVFRFAKDVAPGHDQEERIPIPGLDSDGAWSRELVQTMASALDIPDVVVSTSLRVALQRGREIPLLGEVRQEGTQLTLVLDHVGLDRVLMLLDAERQSRVANNIAAAQQPVNGMERLDIGPFDE